MDQIQPSRGRSPAPVDQQALDIKQSHSPSHSPARAFDANYQAAISNSNSIGLGLALDSSSQQAFNTSQADLSAYNGGAATFLATTQPGLQQQDLAFDPNLSFADQLKADPTGASFGQGFLDPQQAFPNEDFTIFPTSSADQLSTPLFDQQQPQQQQQQDPFGTSDINTMATSQAHHSPTPPHLLGVDALGPGSAHQSPSFNNHQFVQPVGRHSRNTSLAPEAALMHDWNAPHFQGHRRTGSEFSDASSIGGHSPSIVGQDSFSESIQHQQSSPMLRAEENGDVYQELHGINSFSISNGYVGRSPSHSPAISPRILPQPVPDVNQSPANFILQAPNDGTYASYAYGAVSGSEAFPQLPTTSADMAQPIPQIAPTIEIDFAPTTVASRGIFDGKAMIDTDALTPPEQRGM